MEHSVIYHQTLTGKNMTLKITYHIPIKAKFNRHDLSCKIYIPFKKWLFGYGGWGKSKWVRLLGWTFFISYWKLNSFEITIEIV